MMEELSYPLMGMSVALLFVGIAVWIMGGYVLDGYFGRDAKRAESRTSLKQTYIDIADLEHWLEGEDRRMAIWILSGVCPDTENRSLRREIETAEHRIKLRAELDIERAQAQLDSVDIDELLKEQRSIPFAGPPEFDEEYRRRWMPPEFDEEYRRRWIPPEFDEEYRR